jgi:hypothetical protein
MQNGSLIRAERQTGPDVWEFRWREPAGNDKRTHRRIVLGSVDRLVDEAAALTAAALGSNCDEEACGLWESVFGRPSFPEHPFPDIR